MRRFAARIAGFASAAILVMQPIAAAAQVRTVDPNQALDRGTAASQTTPSPSRLPSSSPQAQTPMPDAQPGWSDPVPVEPQQAPQGAAYQEPAAAPRVTTPATGTPPPRPTDTYKRDDLLSAGERTLGKGAQGLAGMIERILRDQGEPNAYIAGREASGAIAIGLRYGSGTLSHKVEGDQPIFWTGPSLGFDLGGDANKVFVLVYNLYDTEDLYKRFPGGEGRLYLVGGLSATYLRRGNIVLIPVRLGVGWRAGVNINYMKFSHKSRWLPF